MGDPALAVSGAVSDAGANAARARQTASDAAAAARNAERVAASPPDSQGVPAYVAAHMNNALPQSPGATGGPPPGAPTPARAALADRAAQGQIQLQQNALPSDAAAVRAPDALTQNGQPVASGNAPATSAPLGNANAQDAAGVSPDQAAAARASAQSAARGDAIPTRATPPAEDAAAAAGAAPAARDAERPPEGEGAQGPPAARGTNSPAGAKGAGVRGGGAPGPGAGGPAGAGPRGAAGPVKGGGARGASAADVAADTSLDGLSTANVALIDEELAEHQRWGAAAARVGSAGSSTRAQFLASQYDAGLLGGGATGFVQGFATGAAIKAIEIVAVKAAARIAGQAAAKSLPIPAIGAVIGGVMSAMDLADRDWGATGETVGKFGQGASDYEKLANSIAAICEVISVATAVLNVIAGIIGVIAIVSWIITAATVGGAAPFAALLSKIAFVIGIAAMALDAINAIVLQPLVATFRSLHEFKSQGDPTQVEKQGEAIRGSGAASAGFVGGFAGAHLGGKAAEGGAKRLGGTPSTTTPHDTPPPASGDGPNIHADPPPAPVEGQGTHPADGPPAASPADAPAPAADAHPAAPADAPGHQTTPADAPAPAAAPVDAPVPAADPTHAAAPAAAPADAPTPAAAPAPAPAEAPGKTANPADAPTPAADPAHPAAPPDAPASAKPADAPAPVAAPADAPASTAKPADAPTSTPAEAPAAAKPQRKPRSKKAEAPEPVPDPKQVEILKDIVEAQQLPSGSTPDQATHGNLPEAKPKVLRMGERHPGNFQVPGAARSRVGKQGRKAGMEALKEATESGIDNERTAAARETLEPDRRLALTDEETRASMTPEERKAVDATVEASHVPAVAQEPHEAHTAKNVEILDKPDHREGIHDIDTSKPLETSRPNPDYEGRPGAQPPRERAPANPKTDSGHLKGTQDDAKKIEQVFPDTDRQRLAEAREWLENERASARAREQAARDAKRAARQAKKKKNDPDGGGTPPGSQTPPAAPPAAPPPGDPSPNTQAPPADAVPQSAPEPKPTGETTDTTPAADAEVAPLSSTAPAPVTTPATEPGSVPVPVPAQAPTSAPQHPSTALPPGSAPPVNVPANPSTLGSLRHGYLGTLGEGAVGAIPGVEQVKKIGKINSSWFGDERMRAPASRRDIDGNPVPYTEQELAAIRGNNAEQQGGVGSKVREGIARRRADFNFGYNKAANEPIVEHVSPNYPGPPGSLEEMNALQERLARILAARAQAEAVRATSSADASHHQANTAPLQKFDQGAQRTITASEAHAQATARRQTATQQREQKEGDVSGGIADYNQRKTGLSAIKVPLGLVHDWAPLASSLPDGISAYPTALVGPKRKIAQLDKDASDFLKALNGVDAKMTSEGAAQPARTKEVADNKQKLQGVQSGAASSKATLTQAKTDGTALADRNQKRIGDSQKLSGQASATGSQLDGEKAKTEADITSLAGRWQSWAQSHSQARATAIAATRKAMEAQGYKVREVNQK